MQSSEQKKNFISINIIFLITGTIFFLFLSIFNPQKEATNIMNMKAWLVVSQRKNIPSVLLLFHNDLKSKTTNWNT